MVIDSNYFLRAYSIKKVIVQRKMEVCLPFADFLILRLVL